MAQLSETLSQDRAKNGEKLKFLAESHLVRVNGEYNEELYQLLQKKLPFPFQYSYSRSKMESIKSLPAKRFFISTLSGKVIKNQDYENVKRVWDILQLDNLYQLYEFYCTLDCYLLAESFDEFRKNCFNNYTIWPDYYLSLPAFSLGNLHKLRYTFIK